jgi:hypothetical protein
VTTASAQPTATCGGASVNLLTTAQHCGRCDHSCGADACVEGLCVARTEDTGAVILHDVRDGALYYARRPAGSLGGAAHEIKRFIPASGPVLLGSLEVDGSTEKTIMGASAGPDYVYLRTNTSLRRASVVGPSSAVPELVVAMTANEQIISVSFAGDRVYVTTPSANRVDQVFFDGGVQPFITDVPNLGETRVVGAKFVYFSQAFAFFPYTATASSVRYREGAVDKPLFASADRAGSLAPTEGDELYVLRVGAPGAIVRINLTTLATEPFYEGELDNSLFSMSVAADATHVFWLKGGGDATEVWKRARCGGAAVRIGKHKNAYRVMPLGDRIYVGAEDGLFSIAK